MQSSFADSGHFEDITTSSMHSKDSFAPTQERLVHEIYKFVKKLFMSAF